jgi:hypothetical protein
MADSALSPVVLNALTAMNATRPSMAKGDLATVGITAFVKVMGAKVASGDIGQHRNCRMIFTLGILSTGRPDLLPSVYALHAYDIDVRAGRAGQCASERISG